MSAASRLQTGSLLTLIAVAVAVLLGCQQASSASITIGLLHSLSSPEEQAVLNAELLAIDEINNDGGILGTPISYRIANSQQMSAALTNMSASSVKHIFGGTNSATRKNFITANQAKANAFTLWYPHPFEGQECSKNVYYLGSTPNLRYAVPLEWMILIVSQQLFVTSCGADTSGAISFAKKFAQSRMGVIVGEHPFLNTGAAISAVQTAKDSLPDGGIIINFCEDDALNTAFFQEYNTSAATTSKWPVLAFGIKESSIPTIGTNLLEGIHIAASYFSTVNNQESTRFVAAYRSKYGVNASITADMQSAYVAIHLWAQTTRTSGMMIADFDKILFAQVFAAPEGDVFIPANHHLSRYMRIAKVKADGTPDIIFETNSPLPALTWSISNFADGGAIELENKFYVCDWALDAVTGDRIAEPVVKVGILHSFTGTLAISEIAVVMAELLAIEEINLSGGARGHRIIPVIANGASDPSTFREKADVLTSNPDVVTVFGCWTSASRKAVLPVFESKNHLLWYPVQYEGQECSKNVFYTGATPNQQIEPAVEWLILNKGTDFYLVGSNYVFPRTANQIIRAYCDTYGVRIFGEEYVPLGNTVDIPPIIVNIKNALPNGGVIFNTLNGDSNVEFFRQLALANLTADKYPVMSVSISETETQVIGPQYMEGQYASWNFFHTLGEDMSGCSANPYFRESAKKFVTAFRNRFGDKSVLNDPMEAGYIMVYLWKQSAEQANSFNVDDVRSAAYGQYFRAPGALVTMNSNHHISKNVFIGRARSDGLFDVVFQTERPVRPVPWNQYVNTTRGFSCDFQTSIGNFSRIPTVEIGVVLSVTGSDSVKERKIAYSMQTAIDAINLRGGILGKTVLPLVIDGKSKPQTFVSAVSKVLANNPDIQVFFGVPQVEEYEALAPVFSKQLNEMNATQELWAIASSPGITCTENVVSFGGTPMQPVRLFVDWFEKRGVSRFYFIGDKRSISNQTAQLAANHIASLNGALLGSVLVSSGGNVDFSSQVVGDLYQRCGDSCAILVSLQPTAIASFLQSLRAFSKKFTRFPVALLHAREDAIANTPSSLLDGVFIAGSYFESTNLPQNREFEENIRGRLGRSAPIIQEYAAGYSMINFWAQAVNMAGSFNITEVRLTSQSFSSSSPLGSIQLLSSNQVSAALMIASPNNAKQFDVVYPADGSPLQVRMEDYFQAFAISRDNSSHLPLSSFIDATTCPYGPKIIFDTYDTAVMATVNVLAVLAAILVCFFMAMVAFFWNTSLIVRSTRVFCMGVLICSGIMIASGSLFVTTPHGNPYVCNARIWLVSLPLVALYSMLMLKTWRVDRIFVEVAKLRKVTITNRSLLIKSLLLSSFTIIVNIIWDAVDPPTAVYSVRKENTTLLETHVFAECTENSVFLIIHAVYTALILASSLFLAWKIYDVPSDFNESAHNAACILLNAFLALILFPVNYYITDNVNALALIRGLGIELSVIAISLAIFFPKFLILYKDPKARTSHRSGFTNPGTGGGAAKNLSHQDSNIVAQKSMNRGNSAMGGPLPAPGLARNATLDVQGAAAAASIAGTTDFAPKSPKSDVQLAPLSPATNAALAASPSSVPTAALIAAADNAISPASVPAPSALQTTAGAP